ncbi:MAG: hypothetical protein AB7D33_04055, partial [Sphingobium sp.]
MKRASKSASMHRVNPDVFRFKRPDRAPAGKQKAFVILGSGPLAARLSRLQRFFPFSRIETQQY